MADKLALKLRWVSAVVGFALWSAPAKAADTTPPIITASNIVAECRGQGTSTSAYINPTVKDDQDPLPTTQILVGGVATTDPRDYSYGNTSVTIKACDHSNNCATKTIVVSITDTTAPTLNVGPDVVKQCASASGTPVVLQTPVAADACFSTTVITNDELASYALGTTWVHVRAADPIGNLTTKTVKVTVVDHVPPTVSAGSDFSVFSQGNCTVSTADDGTRVDLPRPVVSDNCSETSDMLVGNSVNFDGNPLVCVKDGQTTTIQWTAYDESGNPGTGTLHVTSTATSAFTVTVAADNGTPFVKVPVHVTAQATGATGAVSWVFSAEQPPDSPPLNGSTTSADFSAEGIYCPVYVVATDSTSAKGLPTGALPCFAIDKAAPTYTFTGIDAGQTLYYGSTTPYEVSAQDTTGPVHSGVKRIIASIDPTNAADWNTGMVVADHDYSATCSTSPFGLPTCADSRAVVGCNKAVASCSGGRLRVGNLTPGPHAISIYVLDFAGNVETNSVSFFVADLTGSLAQSITDLGTLISNVSTPLGSLAALREAKALLTTAESLMSESPGLTYLLARRAWQRLSVADAAGADVSAIETALGGTITGEARRYFDRVSAEGLTDWSILAKTGADPSLYSANYSHRTFLMNGGGTFHDYRVVVADALLVASGMLAQADEDVRTGGSLEAIDAAIVANDAMVMLFMDQTLATLFSRTVHEAQAGVDEAYYRAGTPSQFGDVVAETVANEITRVAANPGLPAEAAATMADVVTLVSHFQTNVAPIHNWTFPPDYYNKTLTEGVYLNAQQALEKLRTIQDCSVYTRYWQAALALTVGYVVNFSMYEGPTALTRGLNLTGTDVLTVAGPRFVPNSGVGSPLDPVAQTAECRYNLVMYDLMRGRVTQAAQRFTDSKCLIIDLYNRYYANRSTPFFACNTTTGAGDCPIDPATYGCTGTLPTFSIPVECPALGTPSSDNNCDGADQDLDGIPDDGYAPVACSRNSSTNPACRSQTSCVNGFVLPCVPPPPPSTTDMTCDGVDDDCNGLVDDEFVAVSCGAGVCASTSTCVAGAYTPCGSNWSNASTEACDALDNNCNVFVDEGLDNDHDGHGCAPPIANGVPWFDNHWGRRRKITFDNTPASAWSRQITLTLDNRGQAEDLVDFPVLVTLDSSRVEYAQVQSLGQDIRFFASDGTTQLAHEIERWDPAGKSYVWVRVPRIHASVNTDFIFMRYGNPGAIDGQNPTGVWDSSYASVWHLTGDPGAAAPQEPDSSAGAHNMTTNGLLTSARVLAKVGNGLVFDGVAGYTMSTDMLSAFSSKTVTLEAWFKATAPGIIFDELGDPTLNNSTWHDSQLEILGTGEVKVRVWNTTAVSLGTVGFDEWHHAVLRYNAATTTLDGFLDGMVAGSPVVSGRSAPWENGHPLYYSLGGTDTTRLGTGYYFTGSMDEARVSTVARSAAWVKAQYLSMTDAFIAYGAPGFVPGAGDTLVSFPVLVTLTPATIDYAQTQAAGQDLRFIGDDNHTLLNYEIESWNPGGTSYVWLKVPQVNAFSTTDHAWLYYGNPTAAAGQAPTSVWTGGFASVWHLNSQVAGTYPDATAKAMNGTPTSEIAAAGVAGDGIDNVSATNAYIELDPSKVAQLPGGTSARTLCAWAKPANIGAGDRFIAAYGDAAGGTSAFIGISASALYAGGGVGGYTIPATWPNEMKLTLNNAAQAENLDSFPVLVVLTPARTSNYAGFQADGKDIRFYDSDGTTQLAYEIESWNASGSSYIWVKVPRVDASSNADFIIMRWGNTAATDAQNAAAVWSNGYVGVWHMNADPSGTAPQMPDSTSNAFGMTSHGSMPSADSVAGKINKGLTFDGSNDFVVSPDMRTPFASTISETIEMWFNPAAAGVIANEQGFTDPNTWWYDSQIEILGTGETKVRVWNLNPVSLGTASFNNWHYAAMRYDQTASKLDGFLDGSASAGSSVAARQFPTNSGFGLYVGFAVTDATNMGSGAYLRGIIDEARVSNVARSTAWLNAQYLSMTDAFITYGAPGLTIPTAKDLAVPGFFTNTTTWHYVCLVYDGTTASLYGDGVLQASAARSWNITNLTAARIGRQVTNASEYWDGFIDEVRIANVARSANWMRAEYRAMVGLFHAIATEETLPPNSIGCDRIGAGDRLCANDDNTHWDCDDFDPDTYPGAPEICDGKDNNCNGLIDEGVLTACANCDPLCHSTTVGVGGDVPFNPNPSNSDSVVKSPDGKLTIVTSQLVNNVYAWTANDTSGTVSKIDTTTGKEVGRYCSALKNVARGEPTICGACGGCNRPSRTAVDMFGNVYVANRAFGYQPALTKIANSISNCIDFNGNGKIDTSVDFDGSGVINQGDPKEYFGENDECVMWTVMPTHWADGSTDKVALGQGDFTMRAVAIDAGGDVWIGNFRDQGFWQVNPANGLVKKWVYLGVSPYGGVIDGNGILWAPDYCCGTGQIASYNTSTNTVTLGVSTWAPGTAGPKRVMPWGDKGNYGIAVDGKNRVWLGSWPQSGWSAARYDPATNTWARTTGHAGFQGRGVTVDSSGRAWVAQHRDWSEGRVTSYNVDTLTELLDVVTSPAGRIPVGVGIGTGGKVWAVNQDSQNVTAIDPDTGVFATYPVGGAPYTYSDFTGNLFRSFTAPKGYYTEQIEACYGYAVVSWDVLSWSGVKPPGTDIKVRVRVASSKANLATARWYPDADNNPATEEYWATSPVSLSSLPLTNMKWIEVQAVLVADAGGNRPELTSFMVARTCPQI